MTVARDLLRQHTAEVLAALERFKPGSRARLGSDALATISSWPELEVQYAESVNHGASCDVAGAYLAAASPPILQVAYATAERMGFSALHELGHHLQQSDAALLLNLLSQENGGRDLEEAACDAFAAAVLIPETVAQQTLADGVTTASITDLHSVTRASRSAVCVTAAAHLPAPGHVSLLNPDGTVLFDAAHGEPRLRRGSDQTRASVVAHALRSDRHRAQGTGRFAYRDGIRGRDLYMQAADLGGFLLVVSVTDRAPWVKFAPTLRDDRPQADTVECECGHTFESWAPSCARCGQPRCPECGRCACAPAERLCDSCWLTLPLTMFDGDSARCRDCA
ncbi:ImmA/IrrE family metallo-endopeptidase [Promicromonospora sp. NPDC019610]|uniref:ImmA/IrrE family metallo-endopeptidase n=1 Tax=Promicromonospora sp. NPDC019610 TaxID=3364405 RepID=UPI0037A42B04